MNVDSTPTQVKLKAKIEVLIRAYESLKEENFKVKEQKDNLENILQEREIAFIELEKRYNQQQLTKALIASSDDTHDAKLKVNRIVREIDQCIALLNR